MSDIHETLDYSVVADVPGQEALSPVPGLVLLFAGGQPAAGCIPLENGSVELGRNHPVLAARPDPRISQRHVRVEFDGERFSAADLGSRNGISVDGENLAPGSERKVLRLLRVGDSLIAPMRDIGPLQRLGVRVVDGRVEGPTSRATLRALEQIARLGATLHITGESGAGKEALARTFHAAGPAAKGPFQAVNCAAIPEGVAERLLFGAKRGAYSGADADADGYLQSAHGGTLFLDEIAELALPIQAKLLRTLETGEVLPLGASRPRKVDLRFCSATHIDLRAHVAAGKFREDLYYRIATPAIVAPPLRVRIEEIPWLLQLAIQRTAPDRAMHVSFVEACLLRRWPGNVRELLGEARTAAQLAVAGESPRVEARHLGANAGVALNTTPEKDEPARPPDGGRPGDTSPTRAQLVDLLRRVDGNVSAAARELGVHRTQLRRWLERHGIQPTTLGPHGPNSDPDTT